MKTFLCTCLLLAFVLSGKTQEHELSLTYAPLSLYSIEKMVEDAFPNQDNYKVLGAFNLDYYHHLNPWLKIGVNFMYDRATIEGNQSSYYITEPAIKYKTTKHAFVVASQIDFEYLRHPKFKLSSGLSIGYANEHLVNEGSIHNKFDFEGLTYHVNFIGFRWGAKHGLTGNLGVGYKGLLNVGYFVRF